MQRCAAAHANSTLIHINAALQRPAIVLHVMSGNRSMMAPRTRSMRKGLAIAAICLFAFAQLAFTGAACGRALRGCLPLVATAVEHGHDHGEGQTCALQDASSQTASAQAWSAVHVDAAAPPPAIPLIVVAAPLAASNPLYGLIAVRATSRLLQSVRLRL